MKTQKLKFADFETAKLSKNQQKSVQGGDDTDGSTDPGRGNGKGNL